MVFKSISKIKCVVQFLFSIGIMLSPPEVKKKTVSNFNFCKIYPFFLPFLKNFVEWVRKQFRPFKINKKTKHYSPSFKIKIFISKINK